MVTVLAVVAAALLAVLAGLDGADKYASVVSAQIALITLLWPTEPAESAGTRRKAGLGRQFGLLAATCVMTIALTGAMLVALRSVPLTTGWRMAADFGVAAVMLAAVWPVVRHLAVPSVASEHITESMVDVYRGGRRIGSAVRIGARLLVTSAAVVTRALGAPPNGPAPGSQARIELRVALSPGEGVVWSRVVAWGPGRRGLSNRDITILRALTPLPRRIPRLARRDLADTTVLPKVTPGPRAKQPSGDAGDVRTLVRDLSRRQILQGSAALLSASALGAAGYLIVRPAGTDAAISDGHLTGAGWRELFNNSVVQRLLKEQKTTVGLVDDVSGVQSYCGTADFSKRDFLTAPNNAVATALQDKYVEFQKSTAICSDYLVVLATRQAVEAFKRHPGLLVLDNTENRTSGNEDRPFAFLRLDLAKYVAYWNSNPPGSPRAASLPSLECADPATSGGGLMLLSMIDRLQEENNDKLKRLFMTNGMFYATKPAHTVNLISRLADGSNSTACVYEHNAISFLLGEGAANPASTAAQRQRQYVLMYLYPEIRVDQQILAKGQDIVDAFNSSGMRQTLSQKLHLRAPYYARDIDELLNGQLEAAFGEDLHDGVTEVARDTRIAPQVGRQKEVAEAVPGSACKGRQR